MSQAEALDMGGDVVDQPTSSRATKKGPQRLANGRFAPRAKKASPGSSSNSSSSGRPTSVASALSAPVSDSDASKTIAKLLILATLAIMYGRLRRNRIPDPAGALAEELSLSDEEAVEIAKPIARMANSSPTGARIIGPIVRNEDVIGALFALYEYQRRIDAVFDELRNGAIGSAPAPRGRRAPRDEEVTDVGTGQAAGGGPDRRGGPVSPWGAPHDSELAQLG